ncbi:MAG: glycosyltransferase family 4 protein [Bacteroidia bacterium]
MAKPLKLLILNYYWPPAGGSGVQRCLKWATLLPEMGIETVVLTVDADQANYPLRDESMMKEVPDWLPVYRTSTLEPYGVYKRFAGKGKVPTAGFANESNPTRLQKFSRFIRGNLYVPDARRGWNQFAIPKALEIAAKHKVDAILTSSPPHSTQLIARAVKRKTGLPWIADLADAWTEIYWYPELRHLPFAKRKDAAYERSVMEESDAVVTISDLLKEQFMAKAPGISDEKFTIIHNGYDESDFNMPSRPPKDRFIITYTGTLADSYEPDIFWNVLKRMVEENPDVAYTLRFVGDLSPGIKSHLKRLGLEANVEYTGYVSHAEAVELMMASTALLLIIPKFKADVGNLPGKIYEYLRAQKPIFNIGPPHGESAKIIEECQAGKTFGRNQEDELYRYFFDLTRQWKNNPDLDISLENAPYQKFSRLNETKQLAEIVKKITS